MARCIIAYMRDSWNGSSRGAMHAFVAATPACAFQAVTASPPSGAANTALDRGASPGDWMNTPATPATSAVTRNTRSCMRITTSCFLGRGVEKRLPRTVASSRRIAVVLALLDGGDRSPKNIVLLAVPGSDGSIGHRQIGQREQTRIVVDVVDMRGCDLAESAAQLEGDVSGIEVGELGLLGGTSAF